MVLRTSSRIIKRTWIDGGRPRRRIGGVPKTLLKTWQRSCQGPLTKFLYTRLHTVTVGFAKNPKHNERPTQRQPTRQEITEKWSRPITERSIDLDINNSSGNRHNETVTQNFMTTSLEHG